MFAPESVLLDPEPHLGQRGPAGLDWEGSWDCTSTATCDEDWDARDGTDLDVELRALLDSVRRLEPEASDADSAEDADLAAVLAVLAERTDTALALEAAVGVDGGPLSGWSDAAIVNEAARLERLSRWATARGYELIQELAARRPDPSGDPEEAGLSAYAVDEMSVAVGISRWAACRRVAEADALTHRHPQLLLALSAGCLAVPVVQRVLDATAVLDPAGCAAVEQRLLTRAGRPVLTDLGTASPEELAVLTTEQVMAVSAKATPSYVGRVARELAQRVDPAAARRREEKAKAGRSVRLELAGDGMAWLSAHLPAAAAVAAYEHLDALAHTLSGDVDGEPDPRSMDAKRADVLTSLLLGAAITPDGAVTPPAPIHVHVIVDGRTGSTDGEGMPGEVARLGPVTADTVRDLLDLADQTAGVIDGAVALDQTCPGPAVHDLLGPGPYEPSEKLKNLLRVRHRTCVFPGCQRPSRRCELDHTLRYPDGPTCICNLAPLCVHHHHLKHQAPRWQLINHGNGNLTWTTPTGRHIDVGEGPAPPTPNPRPQSPDDMPPF
jgi:Domain of unknown function (DUF222)